ncbi:hypothetical protein CK227_10325 [Mesorhizobium sp. WSM4308]|nr:hypothetical protein CK227_10325 [Mesorhizobium sp. WSM4308]
MGDGLFRFTFFAKQRSLIDQGEESVVVARIVMSGPAAYAGSALSMKAISGKFRNIVVGMMVAH